MKACRYATLNQGGFIDLQNKTKYLTLQILRFDFSKIYRYESLQNRITLYTFAYGLEIKRG